MAGTKKGFHLAQTQAERCSQIEDIITMFEATLKESDNFIMGRLVISSFF